MIGGYLVRDQFDLPPTLGQLLVHFPIRFIPPGYLGEVEPLFLPVGFVATCSTNGPAWCSSPC